MMKLPPVVEIILAEDLEALTSPREAMARLKKGLYRDMTRQAEWTFHNYDDVYRRGSRSNGELAVTAAGALNPFTSQDPCAHCHFSPVPTFLRTVGLWADHIYVPDVFSMALRDVGQLRRPWVEMFTANVRVLREIAPLIRGGVIRFSNPSFAYCDDCKTRVPAQAAMELLEAFEREFTFRVHNDHLWFQSGAVLDDTIIEFIIPAEQLAAAEDLVRFQRRKRLPARARALRRAVLGYYLSDQVRDIFLDFLSAQALR